MTREEFEILEDLELDEIAELIDDLKDKLAQWQAVGNAIMEAVTGHAGPLSDSDVIGAYRSVVAERDEARAEVERLKQEAAATSAARDGLDVIVWYERCCKLEKEIERLTAIQNGLILGQLNALEEVERLKQERDAACGALVNMSNDVVGWATSHDPMFTGDMGFTLWAKRVIDPLLTIGQAVQRLCTTTSWSLSQNARQEFIVTASTCHGLVVGELCSTIPAAVESVMKEGEE